MTDKFRLLSPPIIPRTRIIFAADSRPPLHVTSNYVQPKFVKMLDTKHKGTNLIEKVRISQLRKVPLLKITDWKD